MIIGIDLGSRNVKICIDHGQTQYEFKIFDTIQFYQNYFLKENSKLRLNFKKLKIDTENIQAIISTGYGRNAIAIENVKTIPELRAHYLAVNSKVNETNYTLLDIGGQDTKVIRIENSKMVDFYTNDKCAAGTGRYLENMATTLGIDIEELSKHSKNPIDISSTCAIFGESEIIGKIALGEDMKSIYAGINYSVYKRTENLLRRYPKDTLVFSGGVSKNKAISSLLELESNYKNIINFEDSEFNGALGCCLGNVRK